MTFCPITWVVRETGLHHQGLVSSPSSVAGAHINTELEENIDII